jgi:hypothetical protein
MPFKKDEDMKMDSSLMFCLAPAQADVQNDGDRLRIMRNQEKFCGYYAYFTRRMEAGTESVGGHETAVD